jgi:hypothetical protein
LNVGELFVKMQMDFSQYNRDEATAKRRVMTLGNTLSGILKGAFSFTLGMGFFQGLQVGTGMLKDLLITAAQTETINVAMLAVARATGTSAAALEDQKKAVMDLGIAEQEATQMLTRFMQAQLDVTQASRLARVAQDAAVLAGENSSVAAAQITEAIAKQRPELLNAYGMTRNLNDIYADYAQQAGIVVTTTDKYGKTVRHLTRDLTDVEKKMAMLNYIFREGKRITGSYEAAMGTVGKKLGSIEKLALPKKLMQELKTALAGPLLLPALNVWVDHIIVSLERAKKWAVDNKVVLISWGQTIANAITTAWRYAGNFAKFIITNWTKIAFVLRLVAAAFLSYITVTAVLKAATAAMNAYRVVTLAMAGESVAASGALGLLSRIIGIYRLQLHLASMAGIAHVGVLQAVRTAIYSVWVAVGPVGWAILALTGILAVGMGLWNKYSASVRAASQNAQKAKMEEWQKKLADSMKGTTKGTTDVTDATKDQAEAMKKAGKAAQDNIQSFDEVHQIQDELAADTGLGGLGEFEMPGMPDLDMDMGDLGIFDGIDEIKPTLSGFWDWIKEGWKNALDWIKEKTGLSWWEILLAMTGPLGLMAVMIIKNWDKIKEAWGLALKWLEEKTGLSGWQLLWLLTGPMGWLVILIIKHWDQIKEAWGNALRWLEEKTGLSGWQLLLLLLGPLGIMAVMIIKHWDQIKEAWGLALKWLEEKTGLSGWQLLLLLTGPIGIMVGQIIKHWDDIKEAWGNALRWLEDKTGLSGWQLLLLFTGPIGLMVGQIIKHWGDIKEAWGNALRWLEEKTGLSGWELLLLFTGPFGIMIGQIKKHWDDIKELWRKGVEFVKDKVRALKDAFNFQWKLPKIKLPRFSVSWSKEGLWGKVGDFLGLPGKPVIDVTWLAKGGVVTAPTLAMVGEAGPEAVVPLGRSGLANDLADTVAQAVYRAVTDAARIDAARSPSTGETQEIILRIDSTTFARLILPALLKEGPRTGVKLVAQGV